MGPSVKLSYAEHPLCYSAQAYQTQSFIRLPAVVDSKLWRPQLHPTLGYGGLG